MSDSEPPAAPVPATHSAPVASPSPPFRKPLSLGWKIVVGIAILCLTGLIAFFGFLWMTKRTFEAGKETLVRIAEAFQPETITHTFVEWQEMTAKGTDGNILEVATAEATETFTQKSDLKMFNLVLPLGTTVSEISVPATYRYHIDLNGDWFLTTDGQRVMVVAPRVRPSLPVAFDTGRMKKKTKSGWARWDGNESLEELEKSLTGQLSERAQAPETIAEVREESRVAVAKFVQNWLMKRSHWNDRTFTEIAVVFEDELGGENKVTVSNQPATLRLHEKAGDRTPALEKVAP